MNRYAIYLRKFFLDAVFQRGRHVVNLGNRQRAAHGAMARSENVVFHLANAHVVTIYELIKFGRQAVQELLDGAGKLFHFAGARVWSRDMAAERLDMNIHVGGVVAKFANFLFQFRRLAVRVAKAQIFVDFQVKLDEELSLVLERGHVVNGQPHALRNRANGFKQMLALRGAGFGVNHDVRWNDLAYTFLNGVA